MTIDNFENLESRLTLALKVNPSMEFIRLHDTDAAGQCTSGEIHDDAKDLGKHPAGSRTNMKIDDEPTIVNWLRDKPNFNLGLACQLSGFAIELLELRRSDCREFFS